MVRKKIKLRLPLGIDSSILTARDMQHNEYSVRFIPPFHFQIGDLKPVEVLDEIGLVFIGLGLENMTDITGKQETSILRTYAAREDFESDNGIPITTVSTFVGSFPEYLAIRQDKTVEMRQINDEGEYATAQLSVHNLANVPTMMMAIGMGKVPLYDRVRMALFDMTKKFPFIDNVDYRRYIERFSEFDIWLVSKHKRSESA